MFFRQKRTTFRHAVRRAADRLFRSADAVPLGRIGVPRTEELTVRRTIPGISVVRRPVQPHTSTPFAGQRPGGRQRVRGPVPGAGRQAERAIGGPDGLLAASSARAGGRHQATAVQAERGMLGPFAPVPDGQPGRDARPAEADAERQPRARRRRCGGRPFRVAQRRPVRQRGRSATLRADGPERRACAVHANGQHGAGRARHPEQRARVTGRPEGGHDQTVQEQRRKPGHRAVEVDKTWSGRAGRVRIVQLIVGFVPAEILSGKT